MIEDFLFEILFKSHKFATISKNVRIFLESSPLKEFVNNLKCMIQSLGKVMALHKFYLDSNNHAVKIWSNMFSNLETGGITVMSVVIFLASILSTSVFSLNTGPRPGSYHSHNFEGPIPNTS